MASSHKEFDAQNPGLANFGAALQRGEPSARHKLKNAIEKYDAVCGQLFATREKQRDLEEELERRDEEKKLAEWDEEHVLTALT